MSEQYEDPTLREVYHGWHLIFERAVHVDPLTGEMSSYWPEYWDLLKLAAKWRSIGSAAFGAGYQNDPRALDGNMLSSSWLRYYIPEDLMLARASAGVLKGAMYIGIDPAGGGQGSNPDFCAGIVLERIGHMAFGVGILNLRLPIEVQAQRIEDFANLYAPFTAAKIEDIASRGYVYTALKSGINMDPITKKFKGTRHNWVIEKPQGGNAQGNKDRRFMSMGPRFEMGQIRIPGVKTPVGIEPHPDWASFVDEWKAYPAGHDDVLDAMYWAQFACFGFDAPVSVGREAVSRTTAVEQRLGAEIAEALCERPAHLAYGKPLSSCIRCTSEAQELMQGRREFDHVRASIGASERRPARSRMFH